MVCLPGVCCSYSTRQRKRSSSRRWRALEPQGRFLFTAPRQHLEWLDAMTGGRSQSLGEHTYARLLRDAGLTWVADAQDEGENHYCVVEKL